MSTTRYTLFKQKDNYYLYIGKWLDVKKIDCALHLKHGIMTKLERKAINTNHYVEFAFDEKTKSYNMGFTEKASGVIYLNYRRNNFYLGEMVLRGKIGDLCE